jgi:hypothetical protein
MQSRDNVHSFSKVWQHALVIIKSTETCFNPHGKMMTMLNNKENERACNQTDKENA